MFSRCQWIEVCFINYYCGYFFTWTIVVNTLNNLFIMNYLEKIFFSLGTVITFIRLIVIPLNLVLFDKSIDHKINELPLDNFFSLPILFIVLNYFFPFGLKLIILRLDRTSYLYRLLNLNVYQYFIVEFLLFSILLWELNFFSCSWLVR